MGDTGMKIYFCKKFFAWYYQWIPSNMVCQWKVFNNDNILYIVEKVLKNAIQR